MSCGVSSQMSKARNPWRHFELLEGLLFYGLPSKLCVPGLSGQQRPNHQVKNIIKLMKPDVEPDKMIEYVRNRRLDSSII